MKTSTRRIWISVCVFSVCLLVMACQGLWMLGITWRDAKRTNRMHLNMTEFTIAMSLFLSCEGAYPGPTLRECVTAIERHPILGNDFRGRECLALADEWGRPLILEWQGATSYRLRSCGPNGRDDAGGQDDIEVRPLTGDADRMEFMRERRNAADASHGDPETPTRPTTAKAAMPP